MLVLKIIGILISAFLVYLLIVKVNEYTIKKYRYQFFNMANFLISAVGYGLVYFGYKWYMSAIEKNQDILNGQILIGIGAILILTVIYYNIKNTSRPTGLALSISPSSDLQCAGSLLSYCVDCRSGILLRDKTGVQYK